jgi:hypothetical protein
VRKAGRDLDVVEAVFLILAGGVFLVWAITQLASVFFGGTVDPQVHVIFLTVIGGLITLAGLTGRKSNGGGK